MPPEKDVRPEPVEGWTTFRCLTEFFIETAAVNLKPLALSLSKGEQAYGLRQAQPERLFQEQRGRLNKTQNPPQRRGDAEEHREADPIKSLQNLPLPQKILHFLCVVSAPLCLCGGF